MKKIKYFIFLLFAIALIFSCASINTPIKNTPDIQIYQEKEIEKCKCIFVNDSIYGIIDITLSSVNSEDIYKIVLYPKWMCEIEKDSDMKWCHKMFLDVDKYLIVAYFIDLRNAESQVSKEGIMTPTKDEDGWGFEIHFTDPVTDNNSC